MPAESAKLVRVQRGQATKTWGAAEEEQLIREAAAIKI